VKGLRPVKVVVLVGGVGGARFLLGVKAALPEGAEIKVRETDILVWWKDIALDNATEDDFHYFYFSKR